MGILSSVTGFLSKINPIASAVGTAYNFITGRKDRKNAQQFQAQNSLTGRVAEAKAAGIHPLAALGYDAPQAVSGQYDAGGAISTALQNYQHQQSQKALNKSNKPVQTAQITASNASAGRDIAQAALFNSQAKRIEAELNAQPTKDPVPQIYVKAYNPLNKQMEWVPNPDFFESGELVGAARAAAAKAHGSAEPYKPPIPKSHMKRGRRGTRRKLQ